MQITVTSHESHRRVKNVALLITRTMAKAGGWTQLHGLTLAIHIDIGLVSGPPNISCLILPDSILRTCQDYLTINIYYDWRILIFIYELNY